jgi:hypothetical protein
MEATLEQKSSGGNFLLGLLLLGIIAFAGLYGVQKTISHGFERHGDESTRVDKCLNDNGAFQVYFNPSTGHYAEVCKIDTGTWGWRISKQINGVFEKITAFMEDDYTLMDVENYMNSGGYMLTE